MNIPKYAKIRTHLAAQLAVAVSAHCAEEMIAAARMNETDLRQYMTNFSTVLSFPIKMLQQVDKTA